MPQVASDPKVHAASFHTPRVARPAPPDRAPSPFESLIEDTSPPTEPAPPPESKVARSDDKPAPAKSTDCKPAEPNDDPKPAETDNVAGEPAVDDSTAEAVGKKTAKPRTAAGVGDSIQAGAEDEPATEQKTSDAGTTTTDGAVTVTSSEAISIVPAPAQVPNTENQQTEQPLQQLALAADTKPEIMQLGEDLPKAAAGKKSAEGKKADAGDQVETDQPTGEPEDLFQILTKDASPQHSQSKPQTGPDEGNKQHMQQGRADIVANNHRPDADGPAATGGVDIAGTTKVSADMTAQLQIPSTSAHSVQNTAAPAAPTLQPSPQAVAVPLYGVAIEIAGKALAGKNRFEIRLDPPELGRIEVRLDVDRDGNVTSRLTVDRPDTLDLLRRDAAGLERALQDAGLKTANNGLQFSLRDQSMNGQQAGTSPGAAVMVANDESLPMIDVIPQQYRLAGQGSGLDIRV